MENSPPPEQAAVRPNRARWLAPLVLLVVIAAGAAIAGVVVTRSDDTPSGSSAAQLSQVQASCRDWTDSAQGGLPDDQWCTDMFAWMSDQSGGSMMWQGPEHMGSACRAWINQDPTDTESSGHQRCNAMVAWMDGDMSSRGGNWMMQDR
jgi:hypothetical protein